MVAICSGLMVREGTTGRITGMDAREFDMLDHRGKEGIDTVERASISTSMASSRNRSMSMDIRG